jgi:hypothetical protein
MDSAQSNRALLIQVAAGLALFENLSIGELR